MVSKSFFLRQQRPFHDSEGRLIADANSGGFALSSLASVFNFLYGGCHQAFLCSAGVAGDTETLTLGSNEVSAPPLFNAPRPFVVWMG